MWLCGPPGHSVSLKSWKGGGVRMMAYSQLQPWVCTQILGVCFWLCIWDTLDGSWLVVLMCIIVTVHVRSMLDLNLKTEKRQHWALRKMNILARNIIGVKLWAKSSRFVPATLTHGHPAKHYCARFTGEKTKPREHLGQTHPTIKSQVGDSNQGPCASEPEPP